MNLEHKDNVSIILPTFKEAENITELVGRIAQVDFGLRALEVIIVDDNSRDGTYEKAKSLMLQYPWLQLIIREDKRGLSEAVVHGLKLSKYPICIIMDADLSHPPEKIPELLATLAKPGVDLVIGSRYVNGGSSDETWPVYRKIFSRIGAGVARLLIGAPVKDPLSGFLAFKRSTYFSGHSVTPIGWKIGLEIIVKCRCKNIQEVPIHFSQRAAGNSKLDLRVVLDFLKHIYKLIQFKFVSR